MKRYPEDLGTGRFGLSLSDTGLRFGEKGSGRAGFAPPGNHIAKDLGNGRFTLAHLSSLVTAASGAITARGRTWGDWLADRAWGAWRQDRTWGGWLNRRHWTRWVLNRVWRR